VHLTLHSSILTSHLSFPISLGMNRSAVSVMTSYEIFGHCSSQLANDILAYLQEKEKPVYRAVIQNLAVQRKLRPVFVERKPKPERNIWLHQALARKPADEIATQVLQIWLLGSQQPLICEFLDALEIKHDGKGVVDELPPEPDAEKVRAAVNRIVEHYPSEIVAVYLQMFRMMDDSGWKHLAEILDTDQRLRLPALPPDSPEARPE
jgi:hypothetical protein